MRERPVVNPLKDGFAEMYPMGPTKPQIVPDRSNQAEAR